jgi:hypothetical protein
MWLDYDDKYAVSHDGLVMHKKSGRTTAGAMMKIGYLKHCVTTDNKTTQRFVHRMIADRFLPKIDLPNLVVDHINRNKTDNRACNLRWASKSQNIQNTDIKTNTGERYIQRKYVVHIAVPKFHKSFDTLEEAVAARDKILEEYVAPE